MSHRERLGETILWIALLLVSVVIGASVYQRISLIPEWGGALPDSLISYFRGTHAAASIGRFWVSVLPPAALVMMLALATNWRASQRRKWVAAGAALFFAMLIWTELYFVPKGVIPLMAHAGEGMSGEAITASANAWIFWDWFRMAGTLAAYLCLLTAISIRPKANGALAR